MRSYLPVFALALGCTTFSGYQSNAQGTIHSTFDGPPVVPPDSGRVVQAYYESGLGFRSLSPAGFVRSGDPINDAGYPDNGSAYLQAALTQSLGFSFTNGWLFDLVSVDLAEYSTFFQGDRATVRFIGYRSDGNIITTDLTTDGIIDGTGPIADFQTFTFGPEFSSLTRVEIPTSLWSLDNLNVRIPEPSPSLLLLAGGFLLGALRFRKHAIRHH